MQVVFLAQRNLFQDKLRLALSVSGVALAVMLILILDGLRSGLYRQVGTYLEHTSGPVVVAQEGVENLLGATSLLPPGAADAARRLDGVAEVVPILSQVVILDLHEKKQPAYLVGYDPALGGGPWRLAEGRQPQADDEAVIDRVLAQRHALRVGDRFELAGQQFIIVGFSEGTTSYMASFVFIRKTAAEALVRVPGATSFLLITPSEGIAPEVLRDRLAGIPGTTTMLRWEIIANDIRLMARILSAPLALMVGIAFLTGAAVVGLVIYTATVERQREYGVLKAVGTRNGMLYRVVTVQALIAAGAGALLGIVLAYGASEVIMTLRPQFLVALAPAAVAQALVAGLLMALLAALFPARIIAALAPAEVFRR